ncbi:MAG: branched-chain amino acid transport system II carrier protein, partial [Clostridia bacterium]|nr:branched-chain amino acid transport system II carrier protein [Clostridia bacterium]
MSSPSTQPKATIGYIITVGFAIFATYFGAGNLIFPPTLGLTAGTLWIFALIGFAITDVGLGVLGIIATTNVGGGVDDVARPVAKWFSIVLGSLICLFIGPLFCVPRVAATTYEMSVQPYAEFIPIWALSFVFFAITLALTIKQLAVVDIIGKILTPILLIMLAIIFIGAIVHPIGAPVVTGAEHQFSRGFMEGYQTMDGIGSLVMAGIFVFDVRARGFKSRKQQLSVIVPACIVSGICLTLIYGGLTYIGATASGLSEFQGLDRVPLLIGTVFAILGTPGKVALSVAVAAACLTTSIGLTSMVANFFARVTNDKLKYSTNVIIICLVSFFMSLGGVEHIIMLAVNCLLLIYPVVMVLIFMAVFDRLIPYKWAYRGAIIGALAVSILDVWGSYNEGVKGLVNTVPLDTIGFGWIVPAIIGGIIGTDDGRNNPAETDG